MEDDVTVLDFGFLIKERPQEVKRVKFLLIFQSSKVPR